MTWRIHQAIDIIPEVYLCRLPLKEGSSLVWVGKDSSWLQWSSWRERHDEKKGVAKVWPQHLDNWTWTQMVMGRFRPQSSMVMFENAKICSVWCSCFWEIDVFFKCFLMLLNFVLIVISSLTKWCLTHFNVHIQTTQRLMQDFAGLHFRADIALERAKLEDGLLGFIQQMLSPDVFCLAVGWRDVGGLRV